MPLCTNSQASSYHAKEMNLWESSYSDNDSIDWAWHKLNKNIEFTLYTIGYDDSPYEYLLYFSCS